MYALFPLLQSMFGCAEPIVETPEHLVSISLGEPVQLRTLPNNANGNLMVEVTDASGFALPNQPVLFTVDEVETESITDSFGVATLTQDSNVTLGTATWNDQVIPVQGVRRTSLPNIVGYEAWHIPSSEEGYNMIAAKDGALYAYGNELWWVSERRGAMAHRIGEATEPILGLDSGHLDGDGVLDAIAFTSTQVYVLRGRPYGGFSVLQQFGLNQPYQTHGFVGGVINNLNDDGHGDIALASSNEAETIVTLLDGDGSWSFEARDRLYQTFPTMSMVAADDNNDDFADITLIDEDGIIRRFSYSIEGWIGGFPSVIDPASFISLPGATLAKPTDLNGDGNLDTLIYDGEGSSTQDLVFFTIGETITKYSQSYTPYFAATYDVDENGGADIFSLSSEFLHLTYLDETTNAFAVRNLNTIPMMGPLQLRDFDKDGFVDFNVLNQHPARVEGMLGDSDKWTPKPIRWKNENGIEIVDNLWTVGQADAGSEIEVGAIIDVNGEKRLKVWRYGDDFTALSVVSEISLGNSEVSDLKMCNGDYFLINDNGTSKRLRQIELASNTLTTKRRADVEQDFVECTLINDLNHFLLWGGTASYAVLQQTFVSIDAGDAQNWNDGAIGSVNNGQTYAVSGCSATDCGVEYADLDRDGTDELILANANGITISDLGVEDIIINAAGSISTMDIDGNDNEELIITQTDGWVWVYHATGFNWSAVQGVWMSQPTVGDAVLMDVNNDGTLEVIRPSDTGSLLTSDDRTSD